MRIYLFSLEPFVQLKLHQYDSSLLLLHLPDTPVSFVFFVPSTGGAAAAKVVVYYVFGNKQ
ncbi:MAG TPA: hypothetical protein VIS99_08875, partial [Terrimicrobiaceae bacterium]